jgi:hypothetical protein
VPERAPEVEAVVRRWLAAKQAGDGWKVVESHASTPPGG